MTTARVFTSCNSAPAIYYRARGVQLPEPAFLDVVVLRFGISAEQDHYHVPLLISPYSYSTYRGSCVVTSLHTPKALRWFRPRTQRAFFCRAETFNYLAPYWRDCSIG